MTLWHCDPCDFDFFAHDPTEGLIADKLDETRLLAAGLDIPTVERDFANGTRQSLPYLQEYVDESDRDRNVLEIGCSWGYFLKLLRDAGAKPYGVELNAVRTRYVNDELGIPCDGGLEACEKRGLRFKKIFMFYVIEYVPDPVRYLQRLVNLLEEGGKLVIVTPSLTDPLKDLWRNEGFRKFFYDEHAINYFSPLSTRRMLEQVKAPKSVVSTRQGYSFANHVSWYLTGAPRTTGVVGGDNFISDIVGRLRGSDETRESNPARQSAAAAKHLAAMIEEFDVAYRGYLESSDLGNQIRLTVCR
jgi:SAM-dependent methyltransferase